MPFFEKNPLGKLAALRDQTDVQLDLRGMDETQARERLSQAIEQGVPARFAVRFDAARGDGRETLFLPLGRLLLEARRTGRISRCLPFPEGDGYYVEVKSES